MAECELILDDGEKSWLGGGIKYLVFLSVAFVCWSCDQRTDPDESLETEKLKAETVKLKVEKEILEMQLKRDQVEETKEKTTNKPKQLLSVDEVNKYLDSLNFEDPTWKQQKQ